MISYGINVGFGVYDEPRGGMSASAIPYNFF